MKAHPYLSPRREIGSSDRWRIPDEVPAPESQALTHRGARRFREVALLRTRGTLASRRRPTGHRARTCPSRPPPRPRLPRPSRWPLDHRRLRASFPTSWISWDQLRSAECLSYVYAATTSSSSGSARFDSRRHADSPTLRQSWLNHFKDKSVGRLLIQRAGG